MSSSENLVKAQRLDLTVYQGDVLNFKLIVNKDDNSAYPLTGKSLKLDVKGKNSLSGQASLTFSTETEGGLTVGGAEGNEVQFNKVITIPADIYLYDLNILDDKETVCYGTFTVITDITK